MLNRSNIALAALLLFQLVLLAIALVAAATTENRPIEPILRGLSPSKVDEITIVDGQDSLVTIARRDDGWALPNADDFPVDGAKVDDLLDRLAGLDTGRVVAANPANFARLEVAEDEFQRKISIRHAGETSVLYLGASGGGESAYTRLEGENQVYLGAGIYAWTASAQVASWIDTSYVNLSQADIQSISVRNSGGEFNFVRDGEIWTYVELPDGETFDDTALPNILRNAASIRMTAPLGATPLDEYGLTEPAATVEVAYRTPVEAEPEATEADGDSAAADESLIEYAEQSLTLAFGSSRDDGSVVLKSSESEYYVAVRESILTAFADISHDNLIIQAESESEESVAEDAG